MKTKYLNLGLLFCLVLVSFLSTNPAQAQTSRNDEFPPCTSDPGWFWTDPALPSIFDQVIFGIDGCITPVEWKCSWNFGDGTTKSPDCFVQYKQYQRDGDYTVSLQIDDGFGSIISDFSQVVSVRTHDVAITRFTVPQSAKAGQTRPIVVNVRDTRYPEKVQVELYKNDGIWVGTLVQDLPVRSANRTTAFTFNYTFTAEDARTGKVTFKAMAFILDTPDFGGDDWPMDNVAISLPTKVSR